MSEEAVKKVLGKYEAAKGRKDRWSGVWDEIYDYVLPNREGFYDGEDTAGTKRTDLIFDETAVVGLPRFASRIALSMFPPQGRAFRIEPGPEYDGPMNNRLQSDLDDLTDFLHNIFRNSNFHDELHEGLLDLGIGTMTMMIEPGKFPGEINFTSIPTDAITLASGPDDKVYQWFRIQNIALQDIKMQWPEAEFSSAFENKVKAAERAVSNKSVPKDRCRVLTAMCRDTDAIDAPKWDFYVIAMEEEELFIHREIKGSGENPFVTARWSKASGDAYGRGPVMQVLPAIKTANLTMRLVLENAEFAIAGIQAYDDDGVFNPDNIRLEPGTFVPRAPGSRIEPLTSSSNFDVSFFVLEDMRKNIRKALFIDELEKQGKTPLSATEVAERMADTARDLGSVGGRLWHEFVVPMTNRVLKILDQQGVVRQFPGIDGRRMRLVPTSPLLVAQNQTDIANFLRFMEAAQFSIGESAFGMLDQYEVAQYLGKLSHVPNRLFQSKEQVEQQAQAIAQAAQAQQIG